MLNIILETTTGLLLPSGLALQLPRGPESATLQLVTNNVAGLLGEGQPLALKIYDPADLVTPLATFNAWTPNASFNLYQATLNPLVTGLGWTQLKTLVGRITYGVTDSQLFQVLLVAGGSAGAPVPPIVITQPPSGPVNYVQAIGQFGGKALLNQVEGFWRAKAACSLLGLQLNAQDAPTGAAMLVEVIKNGAATGKIATLNAAAKTQETIFGAPLAVAIGDIIQFKPTQLGSTKPGTNLGVAGVVQLT